jgi:hypothetical protein
MRVTTGQRVSLHQVESAATELRDGQTYFVYEHIAQARARPAAALRAAPLRAAPLRAPSARRSHAAALRPRWNCGAAPSVHTGRSSWR